MSVLTLAGKPIDWFNPPKATAMVMWSNRTSGGKIVKGSLRTIAHLDHLNTLAIKKYGRGIIVLQGPYNTTVAASAGTHDFDACIDAYIPGVAWSEQERFFRANGGGAYHREPPAFGHHIHYFTLPPREGRDVSDDYRSSGFKVGKYVDGGWSTQGRRTTSSQIEDYYQHKSALAGHRPDDGWFPPDITKTIFDLPAFINRQKVLSTPSPKETARGSYTWFQPGAVGQPASAVLIGVRREFGKMRKPTIHAGSPATSEGKHITGKGINARPILRAKVKIRGVKVKFGTVAGHAPPSRAPKARDLFMKRFAKVAGKFKGGDLNLTPTKVKRLLGKRVVGVGVLCLVIPPAATWKLIETKGVNVGGDHKAVLVTLRHRRTGRVVRFLVINAMSVSAGKKKSSAIFARGLALNADVILGSECADFRATNIDR